MCILIWLVSTSRSLNRSQIWVASSAYSNASDILSTQFVTSVLLLACSPALESCHNCAGSACKAVNATLESSSAEVSAISVALVPQQAALKALLQQAVMVLGVAPEDLFEGLVERLEATIKTKYDGKLQAAIKEATLAQASLAQHVFLQLETLPT